MELSVVNSPTCTVCEEGHLCPTTGNEKYKYRGILFTLEEIEYSVCDKCGTELVNPEQSKKNNVRIKAEHREIDRMLNSD